MGRREAGRYSWEQGLLHSKIHRDAPSLASCSDQTPRLEVTPEALLSLFWMEQTKVGINGGKQELMRPTAL